MTLFFRVINPPDFGSESELLSVDLPLNSTVGDFKQAIENKYSQRADKLRVINSSGLEYQDSNPTINVVDESLQRIPFVIQIPYTRTNYWTDEGSLSEKIL